VQRRPPESLARDRPADPRHAAAQHPAPGFGVRLTPETLPPCLAGRQTAAASWREANPGDARDAEAASR
jgi:hypothetical protein